MKPLFYLLYNGLIIHNIHGGVRISNSIFRFANNNLRDVLANCLPGELLYAPIDVAKYNHSAMIVNFLGDIIIPKFDFPYDNHGIDFLKNKLESACKITAAKKLFLALESTGHYHENLVASLVASGYDIAIIRPIDSKNERDNVHAKTDAIDLAAIARVIISNKGTRSNMPDTIYYCRSADQRQNENLQQAIKMGAKRLFEFFKKHNTKLSKFQ